MTGPLYSQQVTSRVTNDLIRRNTLSMLTLFSCILSYYQVNKNSTHAEGNE